MIVSGNKNYSKILNKFWTIKIKLRSQKTEKFN